MLGRPADDGACAVDQLAPEIVVGASSDAAEPWLAASCILPGHQPDPGCHLAARAKLTAIVDAADDRSGDDPPHPRQLCEPPISLARAAECDNHPASHRSSRVVSLVERLTWRAPGGRFADFQSLEISAQGKLQTQNTRST